MVKVGPVHRVFFVTGCAHRQSGETFCEMLLIPCRTSSATGFNRPLRVAISLARLRKNTEATVRVEEISCD